MSGIAQTVVLLAATAVVSGLASGRRPHPVAAWVAPLPALLALQVASAAIVLPGIALALFAGAAWRNRGVLPLPTAAFLATLAASSVVALLPFVAHRFLAAGLPTALAPLVFPAVLVVIEQGSSQGNPFGTWGALGYSQRRNLPLLQLAAVTGLWGVGFLVVWPASALATAFEHGLDGTGTRVGLAVCVVTVGVAHLVGARRLARAGRAVHRTVRVAALSRPTELAPPGTFERLLTSDLSDQAASAEARSIFSALQEHLLAQTAAAAAAGARLVVWPEADAPTLANDATALLDRIRETAKRHNVLVLAGLVTIEPKQARPFDNHLVLVDPAGDVLVRYRKVKLVPGFEAELSQPGDATVPVVDTAVGRIATAICFDLDFPDHLRAAGRGHAHLLLAPASDWPAIDRLHADMAAFRAVENGVTLVRAARWGRSEIVDPYGRTLAAADHVSRSGTTVFADVPLHDIRTLHQRAGNVVSFASAAFLLAALGAALAPLLAT